MSIAVLVRCASFAVDFARVQTAKAELQTAADSAARAAIVNL